jgi:hypothetical protein
VVVDGLTGIQRHWELAGALMCLVAAANRRD